MARCTCRLAREPLDSLFVEMKCYVLNSFFWGAILCICSQEEKCKLVWYFSNLWCTRRIRICVFIDINILYIMAYMRYWFMCYVYELYLLYISEFQLTWNYSVPMNIVWYHGVYYNKNCKRLFKIGSNVYLECLTLKEHWYSWIPRGTLIWWILSTPYP